MGPAVGLLQPVAEGLLQLGRDAVLQGRTTLAQLNLSTLEQEGDNLSGYRWYTTAAVS